MIAHSPVQIFAHRIGCAVGACDSVNGKVPFCLQGSAAVGRGGVVLQEIREALAGINVNVATERFDHLAL